MLLPLTAAAQECDSLALPVMRRLSSAASCAGVEMLKGQLYLKQRVEVEKKNLLVSLFPDMTRFDKGVDSYLSEFVYSVTSLYRSLPEMRRMASQTSHKRGSGEMDRVLAFLSPLLFGERLFAGEYLSPLAAPNHQFYKFRSDTSFNEKGAVRILFSPRYDNIQLFGGGSVVVSLNDSLPLRLTLQGWDEQSRFSADIFMGRNGLERYVADSVVLDIDYSFLGNSMGITVTGKYEYELLQPHEPGGNLKRNYDITSAVGRQGAVKCDAAELLSAARTEPLSDSDSAIYLSKGMHAVCEEMQPDTAKSGYAQMKQFLWRVGDEAISSHTLAWGESDLKFSPLINPSYLSYSSSQGLSYKLSMNLRVPFSQKLLLQFRPMVGYNFKYNEFYWSGRGELSFAPMKRGAFSFDIGRGSSIYSSSFIDAIKNTSLDSLDFAKMPILYYRDFHVRLSVGFEPVNGLAFRAGATMYRRSLYGDAALLQAGKEGVRRVYRQFAPHLKVVWHPGMYYYVSGDRKVNLGSLAPRFALDVEQGVSGIFGSRGVYTRAELDVQHKLRVTSSGSLYLRAGAGGYFHTKDIYFVNYAFLKDNMLPLDKEDETSGMFHLLGREWYNSAKKYLRLNASYSSPFLLLQRVVPQARFIKNETLYAGMLFISHLCPYWECGYGVETPYVDLGVFVGFENEKCSSVGYKVAVSLFSE